MKSFKGRPRAKSRRGGKEREGKEREGLFNLVPGM
jgi:hypothetical protein